MCSVRPEQDSAKRSAEGKEPVRHPPADRTGRPPDEIGNDDPHLLGKERGADELVALQVGLQGGLSEESRAGSPNEVRRDSDQPIERRCGKGLFEAPDPPGRSGWVDWSPGRVGALECERTRTFGSHAHSAHGLLSLAGPLLGTLRRRSTSASRLNRPDPRKATTKARPASARLSW